MASNGLEQFAKHGKCRICRRTRSTEKYVKPVGEVRHGYGTGHVWECIDTEECDKVANERMAAKVKKPDWGLIEIELKKGRYTEYVYFS